MLVMETPDIERIREKVRAYYARKGHGAMTLLAEKADITREHLSRFKSGDPLGRKTAIILERALEELADSNADVFSEEPMPYLHSVMDPMDAIALQLERLLPLLKDKSLGYLARRSMWKDGKSFIDKHLEPRAQEWEEQEHLLPRKESK